jgi:hypothetical protein
MPNDRKLITMVPIDAEAEGVTESWLCVDCGANTARRSPNGPSVRSDLALKGKCEIYIDSSTEMYIVRDAVWKKAGMEPFGGCLCVGCLEQRLGRKLKPKDFKPEHFSILCPAPND